ncbi:MAG: DNA primase [Planctomycetota bacterium]
MPEHIVEKIAQSTDVVRLIGRYTNLEKRGKQYVGLCPFHNEKTPSFSVDPDRGLYYCFGCKEGGNVFTFLKEMEGLEFYEALTQLAREAGIDISRYGDETGPTADRERSLRGIVELAAKFYEKCLQKAGGSETARQYLENRQISEESVQQWRVGFAPDGWEHILKLGKRRDIPPETLEEAGLVKPRKNSGGYYDRFRNRLIFPVRDRNHMPIGFGARALDDEDQPKYLNSPEGPLFNKRRCFYGFCEARDAIRSSGTAIIVEGYTDVIMAHQFGIDSAMAVLGTALTEYHARTLSNLCDTVVLVFDADEAGQKSADRSIEVLLAEDIEPQVAGLEEGMDPCDYLLSNGADAFRSRVEASENYLEFRFRRASERYDLETVNGRSQAFDELLQIPAAVNNGAKRDMLVREIAQELGVTTESAFDYLERTMKHRTARDSRATSPPSDEDSVSPSTMSAARSLPGELAGLLLNHPSLQKKAVEDIDLNMLQKGRDRRLLEKLFQSLRSSGSTPGDEFVNRLNDSELISLATRRLTEEQGRTRAIDTASAQDRYQEYIECLEKLQLRRQRLEMLKMVPEEERTAQEEEDEMLRRYEKMRREEDRDTYRIKPGKDS